MNSPALINPLAELLALKRESVAAFFARSGVTPTHELSEAELDAALLVIDREKRVRRVEAIGMAAA